MGFVEAISEVSRLAEEGLVEAYAIGGAVAAAAYLEASETEDLDVFVIVPGQGAIVDLGPVWSALLARGGVPRGAYVELHGVPVQLLGPDALAEDGIRTAILHQLGSQKIPILPPEHLAALALDLGRAKDWRRLLDFLEWPGFDHDRFHHLVARFGLTAKWDAFGRRFLEPGR